MGINGSEGLATACPRPRPQPHPGAGRRAAACTHGADGVVDLNLIPNAMIERIEVLRDGASTIYGSDAIAGVINVITRKDFEGIEIEGQYDITQ